LSSSADRRSKEKAMHDKFSASTMRRSNDFPDTHRRCQTALGLARLLEAPLYHLDVQHAALFLKFRKEKKFRFSEIDCPLFRYIRNYGYDPGNKMPLER
jgi:hypothetical protein